MENNSIIRTSNITWKDIEAAQIKVIEEGLKANFSTESKLIKEYVGYVKKLQKVEKPNEYIRNVAKILFPNEGRYNERMKRYKDWYKEKHEKLYASVENLYNLYYELSKEERIMDEEQISTIIADLLKEK